MSGRVTKAVVLFKKTLHYTKNVRIQVNIIGCWVSSKINIYLRFRYEKANEIIIGIHLSPYIIMYFHSLYQMNEILIVNKYREEL